MTSSEQVNGTEKGIDNKLVFLYKTEERKLSRIYEVETPHRTWERAAGESINIGARLY